VQQVVLTQDAARIVGVHVTRIWSLLRSGKLQSPAKNSAGDYVWGDEDIVRLRAALKAPRRRKQAVA
jgi:hypothetical protein